MQEIALSDLVASGCLGMLPNYDVLAGLRKTQLVLERALGR